MLPISTSTAVPARPPRLPTATPGWFSQVTAGQGLPTIMSPDWANDVQDELINAAASAGLQPSGQPNQLAQALQIIGGAFAVDTGQVNALVVTLNPVPLSIAALLGSILRIEVANTNSGPATININGLGAIQVFRPGGTPLIKGDIQAGLTIAGVITTITLNGAQTIVMQLLQIIAPGTYGVDLGTGGVNALIVTLTPTMPAYIPGNALRIVPAITNTGPATIAINGLPPVPILRSNGTALSASDMAAGIGQMAMINPAGTAVQLLAPSPSMYAAPAPFGGALTPIAGATHTYVAADATKAIVRSNGGAAMIDLLPGATAGALANGWSGTIINGDATALLAVQVGPGSTITGAAIVNNMLVLGPGQMAIIASTGTNYQAWGWTGRAKLTANTTIFVSPSATGNDATGTGLTASSAYATLSHAYNWAQSALDLGGFTLIISALAGTFAAGLTATGPIVGQTSPVIIQGAASASTIISTVGGAPIIAFNGAVIQPSSMTLTASGAGSACISSQGSGSVVTLGTGLVFGTASQAHIQAVNLGQVLLTNSYTITGNASTHWFVENFAAINNGNVPITVTLTGTPAFSNAFALAAAMGLINPSSIVTFVGSATTTTIRYNTSGGGQIATSLSGSSYLPGGTAGIGTGYS
jgi:hypothetical protein